MQDLVIYDLLFLFIFYSFLGWVLEVTAIAFKEKRSVNRGVSNGPFCTIYGFAAVLLTIVTSRTPSLWMVFLASVIYPSMLELLTGKVLERFNKSKWWDYSRHKFNLDGYICLSYSLLWGILGTISIKLINPLLLLLIDVIPSILLKILIIALVVIILVDLFASFITLKKLKDDKLTDISNRLGNSILKHVLRRIENAYPVMKDKKAKVKKDEIVFASGLSFYKLFLIFIISGVLGDIVEIFFCRYSMGRWMSRSSLVFGQISLVWGLALALGTILMHRYRNKDNTFLFILGSIMGGAFEYACSVFTEYFFGTVFWSYKNMPFNLNGRINLLFCFFWGFATIIYMKGLYPKITKMIENIPKRLGTILCNILLVIIIIDTLITGAIFSRYNSRLDGIPPQNKIEELCDEYADDDFIKDRWPNIKIVK